MAKTYQYVTGPVLIYAAPHFFDSKGYVPYNVPGTSPNNFLFLGTCERYPQIEVIRNFNPVFNDIGGPMTPFDYEVQGSTKVISLDLNKFNETNLEQLFDLDTEDSLTRGSLLNTNRLAMELALVFSFFGTPNAAGYPDLPPGEYYPSTKLLNYYLDPNGTVTRKCRLIIEASPVWSAADRSFFLSDNDSSWFTGLSAPDS
jgi:hypothetical protein